MKPRPWTAEESELVRRLHADDVPCADIAKYLEREDGVVRRNAAKMGIEFVSQRPPFTPEFDEAIRINYPHFPAFLLGYVLGRSATTVGQRAATLGVVKAPDFYTKPLARLWNSIDHPNTVAARIKPGSVPPNKGTRRPGWSAGRMAETQFKKGRPAAEAHNYVPIGTEKICPKRNALVRKVTDDPSIFPIRRWQSVAVLVWEAAHGPVPAGHVVRFRDGMKTLVSAEITLDRLELLSQAENLRRNSMYRYPPEVVKAIKTKGILNRVINRRARSAQP